MKKVAIAVAAVVAGGLINSAQAEMYIGGKVGMTTLDDACYLNSPCDDDAFGAGMHIGYDFTDIIGLEYGVDYLGNYEANFKSGANTANTIDGDLWALTLAPKFNWHLNDTWNLFAKVGGAYMISGDEKDIVPTGSLGAEYTIDRNWSVRAEYQRYQDISDDVLDDMDANFFGIGVNYKFAAAPVVAAVVTEEVMEEEPVMMTKTHKEEYGTGTFEFDSATLTDSVSERLDNFVNFLNEYPQAQVEITGYTDSSGPAAYNQKLSERRAQAVADYLIAAGIDADRFTVKGMGEENPVADNSTHEGREKNRRVEVVVPEFQYEELVQPE
ncbi:OmpA family protein [Vibrio owensii]|jgi:OOP family OmpA-OmpF porin|uniref:OmpA family protein n=1 Tax=Vibrio owensii TaxID=696485 RepID=UPI0005973F25|nr:OmpA family protein [Vibrio owensii]MCR9940222.1 OmpA family protein [Vibrio owensii]MDA0383828.1 OmpA family protein [Vibrio owensii]NOI73016.1 OmpA family protein [Vibrio owensii]QLK48313.1 OmpA family protein [Vibrio owensii]